MRPRQLEVLQMTCRRDLSRDEAGFALSISPRTVKNHLTEVYQELGVQSIAGACYWLGQRDAAVEPAPFAMRKEDV